MLEGFAAWLLNTYIGDYFGNVNTDQLRMSLHSGTYTFGANVPVQWM